MRRRGEAENTEGDVVPSRWGVMGTLSAAVEMAGPEEDATGRVREREEVGGHWEEKELAIKELIRVASNWVPKGRLGECGVREK